MLRIIEVESLAKDPKSISEYGTIDKIGGDNKFGRAKPGAKPQANSWAKFAKSKNIILLDFLDKFKVLAESSSGASFLTPEARLIFTKLR